MVFSPQSRPGAVCFAHAICVHYCSNSELPARARWQWTLHPKKHNWQIAMLSCLSPSLSLSSPSPPHLLNRPDSRSHPRSCLYNYPSWESLPPVCQPGLGTALSPARPATPLASQCFTEQYFLEMDWQSPQMSTSRTGHTFRRRALVRCVFSLLATGCTWVSSQVYLIEYLISLYANI